MTQKIMSISQALLDFTERARPYQNQLSKKLGALSYIIFGETYVFAIQQHHPGRRLKIKWNNAGGGLVIIDTGSKTPVLTELSFHDIEKDVELASQFHATVLRVLNDALSGVEADRRTPLKEFLESMG